LWVNSGSAAARQRRLAGGSRTVVRCRDSPTKKGGT
jgi:hypothetical protein